MQNRVGKLILGDLTAQGYQNDPTFHPWHLKKMGKRKALLQQESRCGCWLPRNTMLSFQNWIFPITQLSCNVDTCNTSCTSTCLPIHSFKKYLFTWADQGPNGGKPVLTEQSETLTAINHISKSNRSESDNHSKEHKTRMHYRKPEDRRWLQVEVIRTACQTEKCLGIQSPRRKTRRESKRE